MGSGAQIDISSSAKGPLRQSDTGGSLQSLIRGHSPFSSKCSSPQHGLGCACLHPLEAFRSRILYALQRVRAPLLTVLMTCILLILLYCSLSSSTSYPVVPDYKLYYIQHPHRMDPPDNTSQRLPQAIIIGVRKGGTRALLEFLDLHEQVAKADHEMHFFDKPEQYEKGLEWYRQQMPFTYSDQLTIEKSPSYFITPEVPSRIHKMNPQTKILLIVRDPVIRVLSDYTQILTSRMTQNLPVKSFENLVIDPLTGGINLAYKAIQISIYHHHYRRWLQTFPNSQIHIIDGDKLIQSPVSELAKVESFLGIQHALTANHFYFNKTKGFYCMRRNATTERCLGPSKGRTHPNVDNRLLRRLRMFYAPHNDIFYNITGRKFDWPEE